jgi:hypothetical protein
MSSLATIFLDFRFPTAATWFYLSLLLAIALFFKFSRVFSVRNLDVITLFLLVPGLLLIHEANAQLRKYADTHARAGDAQGQLQVLAAQAVAAPGAPGPGPWLAVQKVQEAAAVAVPEVPPESVRVQALAERWYGYLWLFCGSGFFILRCLFDLTLVRRPALAPNLSLGGLAWLAGALFIGLVAVTFHPTQEPTEPMGKVSAVLDAGEKGAKGIVERQTLGQGGMAHIDYWFDRLLALLCHLSICAGLFLIAWRHFQDVHAGAALATFYLLLPYTPYSAAHAGQWHHVWPMAVMIWAVFLYRRPTFAGLLMGLAAGTVFFPVLLLPLWCGFYGRRGAGRFSAAFALTGGLCLALYGTILWQAGELPRSVQQVLALADWQPWIEPAAESQGFWTGVHWAWAYRMPVFIAYLAFLATTAIWPAPKNLAHLLALSTALLIGIQFWYAEQGGMYVAWYLPLLLLLVFRPNLNDRRPPPIARDTDWLLRFGRGLRRLGVRLVRFAWPQGDKVTP